MKKLLFSLFAIMAFVACTDSGSDDGGGNSNNEKPKVPEITLDATAVNFTTDGGSTVVTFTSSDAWTAETINNRADAWCSVSPTSGSAGASKITITTTANDTADDRTATVVIKSGTIQKTIAVSQKQKDALTVTSSKFEVSADGGEIEIEVKANIDFNVEIDESAKSWVTHRSTRAMKTSTLLFEVDENSDSEKRKANITITSGKLRETVTIYQESNKPSIVLTQNEYTVPSAGETIAVEVKSNVDVTVEMPADVDWITENTTRAVSTNTYYFDIDPNKEYDSRTAKIKFINKENNLSETITITQAQKDAIVIAEDNYTVSNEGGEIEIEVGHNIDFDIEIADDWVIQKSTRALETSKLIFIVAENTTNETRESSITFTSKDGDISQKFTIIQNGGVFELYYTSRYNNVIDPHNPDAFDAVIVSNICENGQGVITFNKPLTSIGDLAFYNLGNLVSITIPKGVTSIGKSAFSGCYNLTSIIISDSVTSIGRRAFWGCSNMESFSGKFASTDGRCLITNEALIAFAPKNLIEYAVPDNITIIGEGAFASANSLTRIIIPDGVTIIENKAFNGCPLLENITIPNSVNSIGDAAFEGCESLTDISIPNNVISIGEGLFAGCDSLKKVTLPDGIASISGSAFYHCSSLTDITIPNSVTKIGDAAFYGCSLLRNITIPDGVASIGRSAFYDCRSLKNVYCKPTTPPSSGTYVFYNNASERKIFVPESSVNAYKTASGWKDYAEYIEGYEF